MRWRRKCIMGDEPGLGKTAQAIGVLTVTKAFPALVICPASLKVNWQRELRRFGGLTGVILKMTTGRRGSGSGR